MNLFLACCASQADPVTAYATWSEELKADNSTLSNGNLTVTPGIDGWRTGFSATELTTGKWIWECSAPTSGEGFFGVGAASAIASNKNSYLGNIGYAAWQSIAYYQAGYKSRNGLTAYHGVIPAGAVVTHLLNLDDMELRFKVDGVLTPVIDISSLVLPTNPAYTVYGLLAANGIPANFGPTLLYPEEGYSMVPLT